MEQNNIHKIKKIGVIGAGVMGSAIASLVANTSSPVILLDIVSDNANDRNAILKQALEKVQKQRPSPLTHPSKIAFITIGNLEDDLHLLSECDLIIEAIIEKIEIKYQLYDKIIPYLHEGAILASNTSTLPLKKLKENLPDSIKSRFVITHFFNPPRYMELVELVSDQTVKHEVIQQVTDFLTRKLGKTIVNSNDTPGFIANRIGCYLLEMVVRRSIRSYLNIVIIDTFFTNFLQLPNTGIFGLYDLIGHDVMKLISTSLVNSLPLNDNYHKIYTPLPVLDQMIEKNLIGRKGLGGFYRISMINNLKTKEVIDFPDLSYHPIESPLTVYHSINELLDSNSLYGRFFQDILIEFYLYLISLIPTVTNNIYDIDNAMKLGYSWKMGPFELLYQIKEGFEWLKEEAVERNLPLPEYIANNSYKNIETSKFQCHRINLAERQILLQNEAAQAYLYQNKLVFSINTKMNCLNEDVFNLLLETVDLAEERKQDLYIIPLIDHFSAGANLKLIAKYVANNNFAQLEEFLKLGQQAMMRLKYAKVNIISCAIGAALGGGCEILLHSDFIVANQELNAGLVEVSCSLAPSFGGIKEMLYRAHDNKERLIKNIQNILISNKSSSADYFILDYGISNVQLNMNKHLIVLEAFNLNLPNKLAKLSKTITLPQVVLSEELDIEGYNDLQRWLLTKFQEIIAQQEIDEQKLLEWERQIFLTLAKETKN